MTTATFTQHMLVIQPFSYKILSYLFSYFSGLKPSLKKSEIGGIGALKGVQVAACYLLCIDLSNDTLKILGTHFSYNKKLKEEKTCYNTLTDIQ